mgnify:FL=1
MTTWFDTFLPSFDYLHSQEALDTVTQSALWWLEQTGIDGFRHDATKHIPDKFWKTLTSRIKTGVDPQRKDRVFQIGETFGSYEFIKSYVNNGMLDSQFNFELFFTLRRIFIEENSDFRDLEISLDKSLSIYGYNNLMGNIMDSHDQVRIMAYLDGDLDLADNGTERAWEEPKIEVDKASSYQKQRTIFTFLMTIPGVPIVYYGDEVGITGANDPDNRRVMQFQNELDENQKNHLDKVSRLIRIRNQHTALRRGDYLPIQVSQDVFVYSRGDHDERLIIALNKSEQDKNVQVELPKWMDFNSARCLLSKSDTEIKSGTLKINLQAHGSRLFVLEK